MEKWQQSNEHQKSIIGENCELIHYWLICIAQREPLYLYPALPEKKNIQW
jgi:hypothetical protein